MSGQNASPLANTSWQKASLFFWEQHLSSRITLVFTYQLALMQKKIYLNIFKVFVTLISIKIFNTLAFISEYILFSIALAIFNYSLL